MRLFCSIGQNKERLWGQGKGRTALRQNTLMNIMAGLPTGAILRLRGLFSAHLHMDEATPHLHIDFIPYTTGSKRGLETRVSLH